MMVGNVESGPDPNVGETHKKAVALHSTSRKLFLTTPCRMPSTVAGASLTSQNITLPDIPELFNENFLDVLLPKSAEHRLDGAFDDATVVEATRNPMMDLLRGTTNQTLTENQAPALLSTLSATLDAFNGVDHYADGATITKLLNGAWAEDPQVTLRIIWCLRSIPDGKGNKEGFYRAFGWLFENHPRTAIVNLPLLVEPVSMKRKTKTGVAHGYWKDLLNIVALATTNELSPNVTHPNFLNSPRLIYQYSKETKSKEGEASDRIAAHLAATAKRTEEARVKRAQKHVEFHERLISKLSGPKFRALYIAVARLFSTQLIKDLSIVDKISDLPTGKRSTPMSKTLSLAGKWAPTPGLSHDKVTNLSSAIALLLSQSERSHDFPKGLDDHAENRDKFVVLRSFYQRWILRPLREAIQCPEPHMAAKRWDQIQYTRVPSIAMINNTERFYEHDPKRFQDYLIAVEKGKKSISGATLMPHELVGSIMANGSVLQSSGRDKVKFPELLEFKKQLAETRLRVAEAQWKSLVENLRAAGTLDNCLAVCDVSGSMGSIHSKVRKTTPEPIHPAVALSLILASLAKPPFNGGFITFSESPEFVKFELENKSVYETISAMMASDWGMNTDFGSVFLKLLLPLAKENQLKREDMVKRLFVFSDMQFDEADGQDRNVADWKTNHDVIEAAYKEAGYEVPQIVYWDLSSGRKTVEVVGDRKGVAMMNGFSPSLLKVFMGEQAEEEDTWEKVDEKEEEVNPEDEFTPIYVMKKALFVKSFDGLVVVD